MSKFSNARRSTNIDVVALLDDVDAYLTHESQPYIPLPDPEPDPYMAAQLASIAEYHRRQQPQGTGDGNTRSNLLFGLVMLLLIAVPILIVMAGGGQP